MGMRGRRSPSQSNGLLIGDAFGDGVAAVPVVIGEVLVRGSRIIGQQDVPVVPEMPGKGAGVGIDQQFVFVEAQAPGGIELPAGAQTVQLPFLEAFYEAVMHVARSGGQQDHVAGRGVLGIEQHQEDGTGMLGVDGEIDSVLVYGGPEQSGVAFAQHPRTPQHHPLLRLAETLQTVRDQGALLFFAVGLDIGEAAFTRMGADFGRFFLGHGLPCGGPETPGSTVPVSRVRDSRWGEDTHGSGPLQEKPRKFRPGKG